MGVQFETIEVGKQKSMFIFNKDDGPILLPNVLSHISTIILITMFKKQREG